jgi:transcriptional regulator with XRE-family HTH domain
MIRPHGLSRRGIAFTEDELEELAVEFAEYAAQDIADLLGISPDDRVLRELAVEVAHAIRCTIDELPQDRPAPSLSLRRAAAETLTTPAALSFLRPPRSV